MSTFFVVVSFLRFTPFAWQTWKGQTKYASEFQSLTCNILFTQCINVIFSQIRFTHSPSLSLSLCPCNVLSYSRAHHPHTHSGTPSHSMSVITVLIDSSMLQQLAQHERWLNETHVNVTVYGLCGDENTEWENKTDTRALAWKWLTTSSKSERTKGGK